MSSVRGAAEPAFPGIVEIHTTFPTRHAAEDCAARLVRERLAACVQIDGPLRSMYAWNGAIESAEEWRCTCKTTVAAEAACLRDIAAHHTYETPELIVTTVSASPAYAAWVHGHVVDR